MLTETDKYQLKIASKPENVAKIEPFIEKIRRDLKLSEETYGNMLVAITEAANNAIIHGNQSDPNKDVHISVNLEPHHTISFIIKDEGSGFDYNNLPDPTAPENLEKPAGRGVFLMKHLADMVIFSDNGKVVEVQFKY